MLSCRVLWEEGASIRLEKSWVRARDVRMCVVNEVRLRVRGAAGRRGSGTGLGRWILTDRDFAKAWFSGREREGSRDYSEICCILECKN